MTKIKTKSAIFLFLLFITTNVLNANVSMPYLFSNNMVLQRNIPIKIWGWAMVGEKISVQFNGQQVSTTTNNTGKWLVTLKPVSEGGPYQLEVNGKNKLIFDNILMGDVWLCSGQSNMEWILKGTRNAADSIPLANFPNIRLFTVQKSIFNNPVDALKASTWQLCDTTNAQLFSAVAYYFGKNIHLATKIPIGLINSSWGGSVIESWISPSQMATIPAYTENVQYVLKTNFDTLLKYSNYKLNNWISKVMAIDSGYINKWYLPQNTNIGWNTIYQPLSWESSKLPGVDGIVWLKKEIYLSAIEAKNGITINFGNIDDRDQTYINGHFIGSGNDFGTIRNYKVNPEYLNEGKNVIIVRIIDTGGGGGFAGPTTEMYYLVGQKRNSLVGTWQYKVAVDTVAFESSVQSSYPSIIYNTMINPLINYGIKGFVWYQGESNINNSFEYRSLFKNLITDWRNKWNLGNLPFIFVQLPNYMDPVEMPSKSQWSEMREAQFMALQLPNTGMANTIDLGHSFDIHPKNKYDYGNRLALVALNLAYGMNVTYMGPTFKSVKFEGNKATIEFSNIGNGLIINDKYGYLKGFSVASNNKQFVWAKATIHGNTVIVESNTINNIASVRYAWSDNPADANLYNSNGLPAVPFRTDNWKGATEP